MKQTVFLLVATITATSVLGQTAPNSAFPAPTSASGNSYPLGTGTFIFTNRVGATFTVDQLATQLRDLRNVVEQTLPPLSALNENYAGATAPASESSSFSGTLSNLVSDALNRNSSQNTGGSAGQLSPQIGNVLAALRGLVSTNAPSPVSLDARTLQDLVALQEHLHAIAPILQTLRIATTYDTVYPNPSQVISAPPIIATNRNLLPTGR